MKWKDTPKEKKIFLVIAIGFTLVMIAFGIDFSSKTSAPWKKHKTEKSTPKKNNTTKRNNKLNS